MSTAGDGWEDDDRLTADLGDAVRSRQAVPPRFVDAGKAAFAWHDIDAELAALVHDSADSGLLSAARADGSTRSLTFEAAGLTIEVEISATTLSGQIVPPQPGTVEVDVDRDVVRTARIDEAGWFDVRPPVAPPLRLRIRTDAGQVVLSETITP